MTQGVEDVIAVPLTHAENSGEADMIGESHGSSVQSNNTNAICILAQLESQIKLISKVFIPPVSIVIRIIPQLQTSTGGARYFGLLITSGAT